MTEDEKTERRNARRTFQASWKAKRAAIAQQPRSGILGRLDTIDGAAEPYEVANQQINIILDEFMAAIFTSPDPIAKLRRMGCTATADLLEQRNGT